MILKINAFNGYTKTNLYKNSTATFRGKSVTKTLRNIGLALAATTLLTTSCGKKHSNNDIIRIENEVNSTDSSYSEVDKYYYADNRIQKHYHYSPTDDGVIDQEKYDWVEMIYPDGKIEKDSLGYKISITPSGERTVVSSNTDEYGHKTTTTLLPDGRKIIKIQYKLENPNESLYTEKVYRKNGTIEKSIYYNRVPKDSMNKTFTTETNLLKYNDKEVLLCWESNVTDSARNEKFNKYDRRKRLIYDDIKNEHYYYKGKDTVPYKSISKYDDCERITIYNSDTTIKEMYFKASDGTITPAEWLYYD